MKRIALPLLLALFVLGFLIPWWPLCLVSLLIAAGTGRFVIAVCMGLILDIAYGAPPGYLHALQFPFALLAAILSLTYAFLSRYVLASDSKFL